MFRKPFKVNSLFKGALQEYELFYMLTVVLFFLGELVDIRPEMYNELYFVELL